MKRITWLNFRRWFLSLFMKYGKDEPVHLKEVEVEWTSGYNYGNYHPKNPYQWWEKDLGDPGELLNYAFNPKSIAVGEDREEFITMNWEMEVRRSDTKFRRGFFQFTVNYKGNTEGNWDAIWLSVYDFWPQEIDIVEWYGEKAETNFHVKKDVFSHLGGHENHKDVGAKEHKPAKTYSCWIEKDFIKIYYDGFLIRKFTDMKHFSHGEYEILINTACEEYNQSEHKMHVIPKVYQ